MLFILILSVVLVIHDLRSICVILPEEIHDFMNEPELVYYFQTTDRTSLPEYELVYLPIFLQVREAMGEFGQTEEIDYNFSAFKRPINLKLKKNSDIFGETFKTFIYDENGITSLGHPSDCHYIHKDEKSTASISICDPSSVQGLIFLDNSTFELHPLTSRLKSVIKIREPLINSFSSEGIDDKVPHIIKRAHFKSDFSPNDIFPITNEHIWLQSEVYEENSNDELLPAEADVATTRRPGYTLELAVFFDEAAYKIFGPFMNNDDKKIQDMLLAYMNGVQALYHHPSLGTTVELVLVRLDIMKKQAVGLPHYDGERSKLLDSFCAYQERINPPGDTNPNHWDMALYVSGLDFFAYEKGRKSGVTMGLATVGGVCLDKYACVIAELGTTNVFGKPYPSAGFTSVYILAHEIGHNLGMHHDSSGNSCPKEGYIMSPSRGTNGETQWSTCSADVMLQLNWAKCLKDSAKPQKHMDHSRFLDNPGQVYTAKKQCEILLRDKDAIVSPNQQLSEICYNLQCKTPHRSGYYFAGPALDGTLCGNGRLCYGGDCVRKNSPKPFKITPGGWSKWNEGKCYSGCIEKSRGSQMKRRYCTNPAPINTDEGCEGSSIEFGLCKDEKICKGQKRESVVDFASMKCKEFSKLLKELDPKGAGLQAPHEEARVWMGCAIFCKRADSGTFYTPRIELNDLGVSPYFPDGTWCHNDGSSNYYCLQHHCLPESFVFTKSIMHGIGEDIPISQNAHPLSIIPPDIKNYLSLGPDGRPLMTSLKPGTAAHPKEEDWETDDYIVLPEIKGRHSQQNTMIDGDEINFI